MEDEDGVGETRAHARSGGGKCGVVLRGLFEPGVEAARTVACGEDTCLQRLDERGAGEQGFADGASIIERGLDPRERCADLAAAEAREFFDGLWKRGAGANKLAEVVVQTGLCAR